MKMPDIKKITMIAKKYKYLIAVVVAGLILMTLPSIAGGKTADKGPIKETEFSLPEFEARIEGILASSEGVGRVKVVLAIKSSMESVYAEEARTNTREQKGDGAATDYNKDSDRKPSIVSSGSGSELPVVVKQNYPLFLGATVVCDGAENPNVKMYVTEAISSLTGVSSERITVIKMKN
ncbi:MAG: hypothetical protein RSC43_08930 [Clostridia bacterium]